MALGGMLVRCETPDAIELIGKVLAMPSRFTPNGGTLKIFHRGEVTVTGQLQSGRIFYRELDAPTMGVMWALE